MTAERMFRNRFFMTVVIRPTANATDKLMDFLRKKQEDKNANIAEALELLEDKVRDLEKLLLRVRPRRVGIYEHRGLLFSEPLEILNQVMTGRYRRCPLVRGRLGSALYASRAIIGAETFEVRDADHSMFGGIFGIREYPSSTTPRQFESLLSVDFSLAITQSFTFLSRTAATERFRLHQTQMANAGDKAISQMDELIDAADDLQSNCVVLGDHHFTLTVLRKIWRSCAITCRSRALRWPIRAWSPPVKAPRWKLPIGRSWSATSRGGRALRRSRPIISRPSHRSIRSRQGTRTRSEEHTSELQSLMRISYAVFCLKKKKKQDTSKTTN